MAKAPISGEFQSELPSENQDKRYKTPRPFLRQKSYSHWYRFQLERNFVLYLIVDKIQANEKTIMSFEEAIAEGAASRLEPIALTSLCNSWSYSGYSF